MIRGAFLCLSFGWLDRHSMSIALLPHKRQKTWLHVEWVSLKKYQNKHYKALQLRLDIL